MTAIACALLSGILYYFAFGLDDAWMHARQAILRGVENGFAVVRVASHGLATVSDDRGRVLAVAPVGAADLLFPAR